MTGPGRRAVGRPGIPWGTVLSLAVVTAYADGFWMISLRGAVGAVERAQEPFDSWWRESTLALPVFVLAVLGALALALRWFGPVQRPRTVVATALLVAVAATLAGAAGLAASSAYDYHLQSQQLQMMESMRGSCLGVDCLAQQRQASLDLQVRAVLLGSGLLLVTNLVVVGWVTAMRGGRLEVSRSPVRGAPRRRRTHAHRVDDLRLLLAVGLVGAAAIHAAVVPEHLAEWGAAGVFFVILTAAELVVAALLVRRSGPVGLVATAVVSAGPLALWLWSRTAGMPFGPEPGAAERVGLPDSAACVLEIGSLLVALLLLRHHGRLRRPAASDHVRWMALVSVVVVAALGVAGSNLAWFDGGAAFGDRSEAH